LNRYRDFNRYLRDLFGERVHKISLDAGMTCPNRDGTISKKGCIFCDSRGSGTGAMINDGQSLDEQIRLSVQFVQKRYRARKYIAYFQSFSNTYGSIEDLRKIYGQALAHKNMVGLSVATRPDCVNKDIIKLLASYQKQYLVWIELGLQSAHNRTLKLINRGHDADCFRHSVRLAHKWGLNICTHIIIGLPGEDRKMILDTAKYIADLPIRGVKLHLMYIIKGTALAKLYQKGSYKCLAQEEYVELVVDFLEYLPPDIIIQRLVSDPRKYELIAPTWAQKKRENMDLINKALERRNTCQGTLYGKSTAGE